MRLFLKNIIKYAIVVIILLAGTLYAFSYKYWTMRVPVIKSEIKINEADSISLILGSSHAFFGFNTKLIDKNCYNFASTSQGYYEDFGILKSIYKRNSKIKNVVLPLSYFSNFFYLEQNPTSGEAVRIFDYEKGYGIEYAHTMRYYINMAKFIVLIPRGALFQKTPNFDEFGNINNECNNVKSDLDDGVDAFTRHNYNANFSTINPYLDSIINFCNRKEINLNIVVPPFTQGYRNQIEKNGKEFNNFLVRLNTTYGNKIYLTDCRAFITKDKDEAIYFQDSDHLSPCGRDDFSRYIHNLLYKEKEN